MDEIEIHDPSWTVIVLEGSRPATVLDKDFVSELQALVAEQDLAVAYLSWHNAPDADTALRHAAENLHL